MRAALTARRDALAELRAMRTSFAAGDAARRLELIRALEGARLGRPSQVLALHEHLLFAQAYPDDPAVLAAAERALARFHRRPDLKRFRDRLVGSGIAGTEIHYRFFYPTAVDLARRFPRQLHLDWPYWENQRDLERHLVLLLPFAETPAVDEMVFGPRRWLRRLRGPGTADGAFLALRFAAVQASSFVRETLYDALGPQMILRPGRGTPSRTAEKVPTATVFFQGRPLRGRTADFGGEVRRTRLVVRETTEREGARWVERARDAMVTRSRDLDAFAQADARDVRVVEVGEGLSFAVLGVVPERRLLLESVYGALTIRNGVPIGYVLFSSLFGSTEVAFNVFDTFRGAEAAHVLARAVATARALFGSRTFSIDPYQLGHFGNDEGLRSGAWWFYYKLGFRSRDPKVIAIAERELAAMAADPRHRTDLPTLRALVNKSVFLSLGRRPGAALGELSPGTVGAAVTRLLAARFGPDREGGVETCSREAARLLGLRGLARWTAGEHEAWRRWCPIFLLLPGVSRWTAAERRAAIEIVRAKGGRREADFLPRVERHPRLREALLRLMTPPPEKPRAS